MASQINSHLTADQSLHNQRILRPWGVHHALPELRSIPTQQLQSKVGVKTVKRLITGNIGKDGAINVDAFQAAILQYRNTPDPIRNRDN